MAEKTKTSKYGFYICKVGYLNIRKSVTYKKTNPGRNQPKYPEIESHEYVIYHAKHRIEGGFKGDKMDAVKRAEEMVAQEIKYSRK